jgi:DNA-directed RNA polymerase subunit M
MIFCPKCKKILTPKKEGAKTIMACLSCEYKSANGEQAKISEKNTKNEKIVQVIDSENEMHPVCKEKCHKCGNEEAYYFLQQTRAADEAPTKFMKCTKCKHVWRDYS